MANQITKTTNFDVSSLSDGNYILNFASIAELQQAIQNYIDDCLEHIDDHQRLIDDFGDELDELENQLAEAYDNNDIGEVSHLEQQISDTQSAQKYEYYNIESLESDVRHAEDKIEQLDNIFEMVKSFSLIENPYKNEELVAA
jgi:predicted S18 family serine protease